MHDAPGPWTRENRRGRAIVIDADRNEVCEAFAAPALIAAAPDLLSALRACVRAYDESIPVDQRWTTGTNLVPDWYAAARAVIARATEPTDDQFMAALGPCGK